MFVALHPEPTATRLPIPAILAYTVAVGVGIDLDHFLVERLLCGEWRAVGRAVQSPRRLVLAQAELFPTGTVSALDRLLSHAVIVGIAVPATWLVAPALGLLTAAVLYGHVLSDLAWDVYRRRVAGGPPYPHDAD